MFQAKKTVVLADGKMLVGGLLYVPTTSVTAPARGAPFWRLLADGTIDSTFGVGGVFVSGTLADVDYLTVPPRRRKDFVFEHE